MYDSIIYHSKLNYFKAELTTNDHTENLILSGQRNIEASTFPLSIIYNFYKLKKNPLVIFIHFVAFRVPQSFIKKWTHLK